MNNTVLKSLYAENYAPFAERINFTTMIDSSKKEFMENTFRNEEKLYNKVSYIYGANGSGKTFFCKILREIQRLIAWSPLTAVNNAQLLSMPPFKGMDSPVTSFAFDTLYKDKPTFFGVEIVLDGITYNYQFSVFGKTVQSELLTKKYRRTETLINRTSPSFKNIELRSEFKDFNNTKQVVKDEALCLPMMAFLNSKLATKIIDAISKINIFNMAAPRLNPAESKESFCDERMQKYVNVLKKADPTLRKMSVSVKEEETVRQKIENDDFENKEIIATKTTVDIKSEHAVFDNGIETTSTPIEFFQDESLGTAKLFTTLPQLFDVLENGGIIFLDEIENGLHPTLVKELIQLFISEKTNPYHAQLICTTHQPLLVNENVRRDQVWVISKNEYGKSTINRISQLKTSKAKVNITNKLLEGALGCNPSLFFNEFNIR